jgi:hypothetical protein
MIGELLTLILFLGLMFLPTFIARSRNHKHKTACFWINLILGWTVLAWIPLLVWSLASKAD